MRRRNSACDLSAVAGGSLAFPWPCWSGGSGLGVATVAIVVVEWAAALAVRLVGGAALGVGQVVVDLAEVRGNVAARPVAEAVASLDRPAERPGEEPAFADIDHPGRPVVDDALDDRIVQ